MLMKICSGNIERYCNVNDERDFEYVLYKYIGEEAARYFHEYVIEKEEEISEIKNEFIEIRERIENELSECQEKINSHNTLLKNICDEIDDLVSLIEKQRTQRDMLEKCIKTLDNLVSYV